MSSFTVILALLFFILLFVWIIYIGLIFPIWMIVHCAVAKNHSDKSKTLWIIAMILLWSLGALIYGFMHLKPKFQKNFALANLVVMVAVAIVALVYQPNT